MRIEEKRYAETARDYALRILKNNIITMDLEPGAMVSENELAAQMGLSRTPVREALMSLAKVKLIEVYPQRGSAVAPIDYDLVEEATFMRGVLEASVVELACEMASTEQKVALEENVALQERYLAEGRMEALMQLDNELHHLLFVIARKEQTWEMLSGFTVHFDRVRRMALDAPRNDRNVADHRAIVQAVAAGNAKEARRAMEVHLNRYRVDEELLRNRYPASYFKAV